MQNETKLARALSAVEKGPKNNKEQKRQESLKRISAELHDLRERLKKNRIDSADSDDESMPSKCEEGKAQDEDQKQQKHKQELEDMLKSCEFQCQCWQGMFNGIIKLLGEVGVLEDNSKCVRQLCDFTKELRQQEHRFFPRIEQLDKQQEQLNEMQIERLASLQKWQRAQNQQVEGIEKLLSSLLDPGNMKMRVSWSCSVYTTHTHCILPYKITLVFVIVVCICVVVVVVVVVVICCCHLLLLGIKLKHNFSIEKIDLLLLIGLNNIQLIINVYPLIFF